MESSGIQWRLVEIQWMDWRSDGTPVEIEWPSGIPVETWGSAKY
jgi:hypothetical protein